MKRIHRLLLFPGLLAMLLSFSIISALALDPNSKLQDRNSSMPAGKIIPPSSPSQETFTKQQPTIDQNFNLVFSKLTALEQTVSMLQSQVTAQAQQISQLKQVISVQSGGTVTIQVPGTLKFIAGGTLNMAASTIDMNAAITGAHGIFKADTMITSTVIAKSYRPGAGNIW